MRPLILASTSRYRRRSLERLGLAVDTRDPGVEETARPGEEGPRLAARLADAKAESVAKRNGIEDAIIVGADQVASLNGELLGKPGDRQRTLEQLLKCQGNTVSFHTACTVIDLPSNRRRRGIDHTQVSFLNLGRQRLERYVDLEEPFDCSGGFKAEGLGIVLFDSIESKDPTALLGLPLIWLSGVLRELGADPLDPRDGD